ncbi:helix-turn-helix domain-containing protein [Streptomyces fuscigenes]|uniref:helix-turn-helix domain-containing protein n=1 Tax=Streptomyces fuscigenes TaxID=1528880 RepID=UPI001F24CB83|nr:helix-turn-helix transcriptional regulator [Streptomyces fuscigenes]MCF3962885.1 helix-turn-helix transcriptional regulator [Streptomyces fuscigenes]
MYPKNRRLKNGSAAKMVGAQLATFRRSAGYTQESLAERAAIGVDTIASIEQGRRVLKPDQAELLDELLDTRGALGAAVAHMPEIDLNPLYAMQFLDLESTALTISAYENQVVPGLLQTEAYARAVFGNRMPAYDEDQLAMQTTARLDRQGILRRRNPPTISFVIWEPVLSLRLGTDGEHGDQIRHLRKMADLPCLTLQVMPLGARQHASLSGTFVLFETTEHRHFAYCEIVGSAKIYDAPGDVSMLAQKYAMLRTQALNVEDSKALLDRLGEQCAAT